MIAYINDGDDRVVFFKKKYHQRYKNHDIYFNNENNINIFIIDRVRYEIKHEDKIVYNQLTICFTMFQEGYNVYHKYILDKSIVRIGNNVEYDIWIQDKNMMYIVIDKDNKQIIEQDKITYYDDGDVLVCINLRLTIHNDFIMCNSPKNIYINLNKLEYLPYNNDLLISKNNYIPVFKAYEFPKVLEIKLNNPMIKPIYEPIPLKYMLIPSLMMAMASLINGILMTYNALIQNRSWLEVVPMLIMPMCMFMSALLVMPLQRKYEKNKHIDKLNKRVDDFKEQLDIQKYKINEYIESVNFSCSKRFLSMDDMLEVVEQYSDVLWSKPYDSKDFLVCRLGRGIVEECISINKLDIDIKDELYQYYQDFCHSINSYEGIITIDLKSYKNIAILDKEIYDYILLQLTTYFYMNDVIIAFFLDEEYLENNSYIRYIPHTNQQIRYIITNQKQLDMFNNLNINKYIICIVQEESLRPKDQEYLIYLNLYLNNENISNINDITISNTKLCMKNNMIKNYLFEYIPINKEKIYLQLANSSNYDTFIDNNVSLFEVLGIKHINELNILKNYETYNTYQDIKAILGLDEDKKEIWLDISERVHGSHGLIAGCTGSGKTELIVSYICSLCVKYSYQQLQFVIIDFKGAGLIQTFDNDKFHLPHLVGSISNLTNLEVNRCLVSLKNECEYRQKLFKRLSNIIAEPSVDIDKYQQVYDPSFHLPYLAHIVIVVDEFAELKQQYPEFITQLISLARIGRSLGIHLILATQKPAGIIDDQIWSNCHFHISLKVQSKQDSMDVIGNEDACYLQYPGEFILDCDHVQLMGRSGYGLLPVDYHINKNRVDILDETKQVIKSLAFSNDIKEKQINMVLGQIKEVSSDVKVRQLWQKPLKLDNNKDIVYYRSKGVLLGVVDDYYHNKMRYLYHHNKPLLVGIESIHKQREFINMYLYNLIRIKNHYDTDVYIFDLNSVVDIRYKDNKMINVYYHDEEVIRNFYCFNAKGKKDKYLIIINLQLYLSKYPEVIDMLYDVLSNYELYHIHILAITNKPSMVYSKIFTSFNDRITIDISDEQELINIFNTSQIRKCNIENASLVKDKNMLNFTMIPINDNDINKLKFNDDNYCKNVIKKMPDKVFLSDYEGNLPTLGISYSTYEYIAIKAFPVLIVGNSIKMLENIRKVLKMQNIVSEINEENDKIAIYEANKYLKKHNDKEYHTCIWVGKGYTRQYIFESMSLKEIKYNEAYVIEDVKIERIKLIEK